MEDDVCVDWGSVSHSLSPLFLLGANSLTVSHKKNNSCLNLLPWLAGKLKASNMDQGANLDALAALLTP